MNRIFVATAALALIAGGCKTTQAPQASDPYIQTIGNTIVPASEFSYVYQKNNSNAEDAYSEASVREYLDLYTNFKLKVVDAEKAGLDTTLAFSRELNVYKKQLAQPYLTEKSVTESLIREAYERLGEEVNASHILISVPEDADPKDTLAAYQRIISIREKAVKGEDFATLARQNSQDPSAATNNGNLGYFTALQMVYPFEQAAYTTSKGEVSQPVRTRFGYHILKVHDRRPSQGQVRTAHIMVRANTGISAEDSVAAKKKADEIYSRLKKGENWNSLVSQFSDDGNSKAKGGELPLFGTGNMIPSFETAAFALANPGDYTQPVQTPYGWHIIKLIERIPLESFEEMEASLRAKVSKDSRSDLNRKALLARLKKENGFAENKNAVTAALAKGDSTLTIGSWNYDKADKQNKEVLFSMKDSTYTRGDFFAYVKGTQRPRKNVSGSFLMQTAYQKFMEESILNYEEAQLDKKYEDYRMLVKEYRDGILLFQLMDTKVWSKAIEDTTGLREFFNNNRENYTWGKRVEATVYNAADKNVLTEVKAKLNDRIFPVNDPQLKDVLFDKNTASLSETRQKELDALASRMLTDESLYLDIIGHADGAEKPVSSAQRARAVASYLEAKGVDKKRLIVKDFAQRAPASRKSAAAERAKNQRASFVLYSSSNKALEKVMNTRGALTLQVTEGKFQQGENEFIDRIEWKPGQYTLQQDGRVIYIVVKNVTEPTPKSLDEARGLVISDYQNHLEKEWIRSLKQMYPVVVNETEVKKLIRN
jgi:peptidyl-prolyl cis-trans isomerase SurA